MEKIREPVVSGYFYPSGKAHLLRMLESFIDRNASKEKVIGAVCPHAGYIYSGKTAGLTYSKIEIPEIVIILGPNHTGYGEPYSVSNHDKWLTPLGEVPVDKDLAEKFVKKSRYLQFDEIAHLREHSIEVQVPFLQVLKSNFKIVPITLLGYVDNPAWYEIGEIIAEVIKESKKECLIIASSDMTHYEPYKIAEEKDKYVIEAICQLDEDEVIKRIEERDVSMCGYAPVIVLIVASKLLGGEKGELIYYTTSAETSKDYSEVVGYAGIVIK
ncbi:MAG: MEMO1 family protein [Candidatus Omnitrophica bacterium]|nr:MEMO1 family protein [Candidatus Omnitrophota bacterium]MCM8807092.1 MEMO1 family protein [Candidatus Omnitrophota bacterium]